MTTPTGSRSKHGPRPGCGNTRAKGRSSSSRSRKRDLTPKAQPSG